MANTRKIAVTQLPSGRSDNCIQFTITDTSDAFVFKNIIPMESTYMFSCWVKTAADTAQITVGDQTKDVGSSWTEVKIKLKLKAGNLQIIFNNNTIYYLYHPILERGNLPTKWTPNPDDTDAKIAGLQESVSKYNTKFNAIDGQISGLVEKTTIKKEDNSIISLQDAYSQFVQTENGIKADIQNKTASYDGQIKELTASVKANANSISSTVKSVEDVKAAVDNIQVGGRNLYIGTKDFSGDKWKCLDYWVNDGFYNGFTVKKRTGAWRGIYQEVTVQVGDVYTFSFYAKADGGKVLTFVPLTSDSPYVGFKTISSNLNVTNSWARYSVTIEITSIGNTAKFRIENNSNTATTWICGLKLERGNRATDWTPAPEDIESNSKTYTDSKIEQTSKDIKLSVTEVSNKVQNLKAGGNNLLHHSDDLIYSTYTFQSGYIAGSGQNIGTANGQQITSVASGTAQNITSAHSLPKTSGLSQIFVDDGSDIKRMDKDAFKKSLNTRPDTRNTNENPLWYFTNYPKQTVDEFKQSSSIGLSVQGVHKYVVLRTIIPGTDNSCGYPTQQVQVDSKFYTRYGKSNTSWSGWQESFRPEFEFDFDAAGDPVFIQHT